MIIKYYNPISKSIVLLSQHLFDALLATAIKNFPLEFGGILTGCKFDNIIIVLDFEIPEKFKASRSSFTREATDLNKYLHDVYNMSDGKLEYLGEWHSHPDSSTRFSSTDFQSMKEIAGETATKNNTPLLLIVGGNKQKRTGSLYQFFNNELVKLKF